VVLCVQIKQFVGKRRLFLLVWPTFLNILCLHLGVRSSERGARSLNLELGAWRLSSDGGKKNGCTWMVSISGEQTGPRVFDSSIA